MIIVLKCTVKKMESHTLEILQQGVWASLTGGWFYDLRQNVFCNTFHLYLWLFLLCFPFILHLYFAPSIIIYSFYCGIIGILFTVLKFINHRLHKMFDSSECIQEVVPGEDLPESLKKRSQASGNKTAVLEDEGIELQVLSGSKTTGMALNGSFNEPTDDDSIISLEVGARAASSTIDLKVDVHRKNSSESSEELSLKPVRESNSNNTNESVEVDLLKDSSIKTPDLMRPNIRCKHNQLNNNKLRLKTEEGIIGIQDDDFVLSQSDCHISKLRKENLEELSEEYKMSQSDCHIHNLRQNSAQKHIIKINTDLSPEIPKDFINKETTKRKRRKGFHKNLSSDSQADKNLENRLEKNKSFDMGNLASNGSYGVLTVNQHSNREQLKNTGSLEFPLKDIENTSSLEKGLLYWKQRNLERSRTGKMRRSHLTRSNDKLKICSDTSIHTSEIGYSNGTCTRLNKTSDLNDIKNVSEEQENVNSTFFKQDDHSTDDQSREKSFLQILEENFDWYSSEYQNEKPEKLIRMKIKLKDISKYKSDENIKEETSVENKPKSSLKFQIDSDEDSSDNCGSRSPLLCRHESLEKDCPSTVTYVYEDKSERKFPRTYSSEDKSPRPFNKIGRTLSVDENVVLSKKLKSAKSLVNVEKNSFSSILLTVYDDSDKMAPKEVNFSDGEKENNKMDDHYHRFGKPTLRQESFLHRNKKLSLPSTNNIEDDFEAALEKIPRKQEKESEEDIMSWSTERVGLDWLFEHTDSETENPQACFWKYTYSEDSVNTSFENQQECSCCSSKSEPGHVKCSSSDKEAKSLENQGAIPKTKMRQTEGHDRRSGHQRNKSKKSEIRYNFYPSDYDGSNVDTANEKESGTKKKQKAERENGIIDEEDIDAAQDNQDRVVKNEDGSNRTQKSAGWKETYDSSSSSTTELSSLLPLSSLLSSLHPPTSPLLAAFLATRKEAPGINLVPDPGDGGETERHFRGEGVIQNVTFSRNRNKRNKRSSRAQRTSRSSRVSSIPLAALASVVSTNSGTHLATSHDDTSQGAVHCFQDEKGNWMSYTFDSLNGSVNHFPVLLQNSPPYGDNSYVICNYSNDNRNNNTTNSVNNGNHNNNDNENGNYNNNSNSFGNSSNICAESSRVNINNNSSSNKNDNGQTGNGSKRFVQPVLRPAYVYSMNPRDRDSSVSAFAGSRNVDDSSGRPLHRSERRKPDRPREKGAENLQVKNRSNQKSTETCDSNINLVSNSNSENDSTLSLNSTAISPNVGVSITRPTFASFVRERFLVNQRTSTTTTTNNNSNSTNPGSNSSSIVLSLNEFRTSDNNNNNNNNNNSNNNNNNNNKNNNNNNNNNDSNNINCNNGKNNNSNNNNNNNNSNSNNNSNNNISNNINISNNNSRSNNNNNNVNINSNIINISNPGQSNNYYSEGIATNSVSMRSRFGLITETFLERNRQRSGFHGPNIIQDSQSSASGTQHGNELENERNHFRLFDFDDVEPNAEVKNKPRHYYKLHYTPWNYIKIRFDRLDLMALLDRNLTVFEILLSLFLSMAVSICGIILLNHGFYKDLFAFLFCFALAGCQYSLLKSVQPDATSPTHGYNRVVVYSRSIYFCATSIIILLLTANLDKKSDHSFRFYNVQLSNYYLIRVVRDGLVTLLLFFPVLFTLGLFPQINTFCLYLLEQMDMHIFGGNAMSSLVGATYCLFRSIVTAIFIYGFAYGALSEAKTSQHILFSIFSGLLISLSYHLSRSSSNPNVVWEILKNHLLQDELQDKTYSKRYNGKMVKKGESDKSADGSFKSEIANDKAEADDKSDDRNSQNNLLLNSNPSSNEMLKTVDNQTKSNASETFENSASGSETGNSKKEKEDEEFVDPLPGKLKETVNARLKNDAIVCSFVAVLVFGIHCSTVFTALQPDLNPILWGIAGCSGVVLHYVVPELRKHLPWLCLTKPVLRCHEYRKFEVKDAAKVMWFEETYVILCFLERNLLYPVLVLAALTYDGPRICNKFGVPVGALVSSVCGLKVMRSAFSNTSQQYLIVIFSALLFEFDYHSYSETFLVDYFFMGIIFAKTHEFLLKIQFVVTYIAPWQITWGSAFHAFAQPFSVPHSAMLFIQAAISAVLSAPLNPFLGSAIFLASYVRPIKFWERDYNTKRVDHSNTRLSSHLERNLGSDDNNLNSIFYEHLTRSLQHSLCGDLELGRWGPVFQGDCFVLASDYLNCLVHIIEMGNGLVTFQMRGLEFRGTYCQQREVEAISERVEEDDGCCCCEPGHIPYILSVNAAFSKRWLAWEVTSSKYVLEGYSISDNSAASTLQVFDFRKVLVTYYVKSIIFYCIRSPKLQSWLTNPAILLALEPLKDRSFVDLDPVFNIIIDQDFDIRAEGITRNSFCNVYLDWIHYCCAKRDKPIDKSSESSLISLCLALSLMGRRTLGTASHNTVSSVEFFLYGLHALFKGDFRITSIRDDWIFADMEFLMKVVAPGVRMSLKLHQDHFMSPEEYEDPSALFDAISSHEKNLVISHEGDPAWRSAVLSGTPSLLALRHVLDDGTDEYKIIMLNKRYLSFRVIKLNRECVRGLWAGQQQELVFLRNRNPERGSIQNAKQVLRNMINSSCDQPIGYPIYVSPLTTSYSDTNKQLTGIIGGPLSLKGMRNSALKIWRRIRQRCREGCSSGSAGNVDEGGYSFGHDGIYAMTNVNVHSGYGHNTSGSQSMDSSQMQLGSSNRGGSLGRSSLGGRGSLPSVGKPSSNTLASLAGLLSSAELPKGECFLRERETSLTFIKERPNREEKDTGRKSDEKKEEKERKKEDRELRKDKEKIANNVPSELAEETRGKETVYQRVRIVDPNLVFDAINLGRRIDVLWPDEGMRVKGGRSYWKDWLPDTGMEGQVVHRWVPNHRDPSKRSNVDKTILLIKIDDKYVPIAETGVQDLGVEV